MTTQKLLRDIRMKDLHPSSLGNSQNRILILTQDTKLAHAMGEDMKRLGLQVKIDSVTHLLKEPPKSLPYDGIILDLDIRESSRLPIFHNLYAVNPHIPIVVVGAENMHYDFLFTFIGGARDFLVKPVDPVRLKGMCLRLFL